MGRFGDERNNLGERSEFMSGKLGKGCMKTYGHAAVPTDNRDGDGRGQRGVTEFFSDKRGGTNDIQGGDTEEPRGDWFGE